MRLEFFRWGNDNCRLLRLILFTDEGTYSREGINNTRNSHWWSEENPHAILLTNFRHCFSANVWYGIIDNQLIGLKQHCLGNHSESGICSFEYFSYSYRLTPSKVLTIFLNLLYS